MHSESSRDLRVVYGSCPHDCPDTCALETHVNREGRAVSIHGRADHPVTRGWLCAKVNRYLERVYHPERLLYPMRRVGPKGSAEFVRISWDDAVSEIVGRWQEIIARSGAQCILPYSYAGTLGLVQGAVADSRLWNRLGACRLERAICGHAAEEAIRTLTARSADQHVQPFPGTDAALALSMMHVIVTEGLHNLAWIAEHTLGWEWLLERILQYPPERGAQITGLAVETIIDLARMYASTTPALLRVTDGINRHTNGGQTVRTLLCLPALTGQYGLLGGGVMYSTSDWLKWDKIVLAREHEDVCPPAPRTLNMNRLGALLTGEADPPIYALYVYNANPAASAPNAGKVAEGLRRNDLFTVVHELFMTETARSADIVLPATSQLEHVDLHKPYGHMMLQYNTPAIAPLGEARSNWDVMRTLAQALGFQERWLRDDVETVIREIVEATAAQSSRLAGITLERLQVEGALPLHIPEDERVPFANGIFRTPSGKVEFYSDRAADKGYDPVPDWQPEAEMPLKRRRDTPVSNEYLPLLCPAAHHFISSTFGNQERMIAKEQAPTLQIHPLDAEARNIRSGQLVRVSNERGWCRLVAEVTEDVRPGVLATTTVWWPQFSPDRRNVNWTTSDRLADFNGGSTFYTNQVLVEAC